MADAPFKIHAVIRLPDGTGNALDAEGNFLYVLDGEGVQQVRDLFPGIAVIDAAIPDPTIAYPWGLPRPDMGTNVVHDRRVVGIKNDGKVGEVNAREDPLCVLGVAVAVGGGFAVASTNGLTVDVDVETGQGYAIWPGSPLYLSGTEDGKVTPSDPATGGATSVLIGVASEAVRYGSAVNGGDSVPIILAVERKPIIAATFTVS